jgi:hypothetical protein
MAKEHDTGRGGMTTAIATEEIDDLQRWSAWATVALDRLPLPYPLTVALVGLLTVAEQVVEWSLDDPTFSNVTLQGVVRFLAVPALAVYMLVVLRILKDRTVEELVDLRPAVLVSDQEYDDHVRRIVSADRRAELALLVTSVAGVLTLFVMLRAPLPIARSRLPADLPAAALISATYVLFGWLVLTLVYAGIRQARALGSLARCPLRINVFDPTNLLPFGRLSLLISLSIAGIILMLVIPLGRPTQFTSYLVILLSSFPSVLALVVPLWGVHQQMDQAQERVLASIHEQLTDIQRALLRGTEADMENLASLADRSATLVTLRKIIQESPNWPFKDTAQTARAIATAMSPLIYFILTEVIRAYLVPALGG